MKDRITYAHAPASALCQVLALRVHLDEPNADNGPLRILPGTHLKGVLTDDVIEELVGSITPIDGLVPQGGVLAMRPLIVHASSKSRSQVPRRVVHIEYAGCRSFAPGLVKLGPRVRVKARASISCRWEARIPKRLPRFMPLDRGAVLIVSAPGDVH